MYPCAAIKNTCELNLLFHIYQWYEFAQTHAPTWNYFPFVNEPDHSNWKPIYLDAKPTGEGPYLIESWTTPYLLIYNMVITGGNGNQILPGPKSLTPSCKLSSLVTSVLQRYFPLSIRSTRKMSSFRHIYIFTSVKATSTDILLTHWLGSTWRIYITKLYSEI